MKTNETDGEMTYNSQILTEKMQYLMEDIMASLGQLPSEMREYIFGVDEMADMNLVLWVTEYITLEFIKYSFDYNDAEYSIRHFLENTDDDSERMMHTRVMQYVLKYKNKEIDESGIKIPSTYKFANTDMNSIEKKLKGYRLTEMNFFEHQNIHDLELIKAIVERRIVSSKKVSNEHFQEIFQEYDKLVEKLKIRSERSDEDMVFASLALFTLEWHYPIETFYYLSCIMEADGIQTVDKSTLALLCGRVTIESRFGGCVSTDSRMVKERMEILPYLFGKDTEIWEREALNDLIKELIVLSAQHIKTVYTDDEELYIEWFRKESTIADWASFFRLYDMFSIWQKKDWTHKRIQNMRYLFDLILEPKI